MDKSEYVDEVLTVLEASGKVTMYFLYTNDTVDIWYVDSTRFATVEELYTEFKAEERKEKISKIFSK